MEDNTIRPESDFSQFTSRNNPPGEIFAPPRYIEAQLLSASPEHLPPIAIAALPYVPQFGSHFGLDLITKEIVKLCEAIAREHCSTVLHVPITRQLPHKTTPQPQDSQIASTGVPIVWGYYVVEGETEAVPIVKSRRRPPDEWALNDVKIIMPIRFAKYSKGKLGPWKYRFEERRQLVEKG
ncbi:hypothetical protein Hte_001602 [Hypoxylon texense]